MICFVLRHIESAVESVHPIITDGRFWYVGMKVLMKRRTLPDHKVPQGKRFTD